MLSLRSASGTGGCREPLEQFPTRWTVVCVADGEGLYIGKGRVVDGVTLFIRLALKHLHRSLGATPLLILRFYSGEPFRTSYIQHSDGSAPRVRRDRKPWTFLRVLF